MKVEISTHQFELSHGKKPKGTGYWFFKTITKFDLKYSTEEIWMTGKLSDCIKQIKSQNKSLIRIIVKP